MYKKDERGKFMSALLSKPLTRCIMIFIFTLSVCGCEELQTVKQMYTDAISGEHGGAARVGATTATGAGLGAGLGAIGGALSGNASGGAKVGVGVGAVGGFLYGVISNYTRKKANEEQITDALSKGKALSEAQKQENPTTLYAIPVVSDSKPNQTLMVYNSEEDALLDEYVYELTSIPENGAEIKLKGGKTAVVVNQNMNNSKQEKGS